MTNWKENNYPFKNFTKELTEEWINRGFSKKKTREWLESGLQPTDASFAQWLRDKLKNSAEWFVNYGDEENLRKEFQGCLKESSSDGKEVENLSNKTQQEKVDQGTERIIAQEWLDQNYPKNQRWAIENLDLNNRNLVGDLDLSLTGLDVRKWKEIGLAYQEIREWKEVGFKPNDDYYSIKEWKEYNFTPQQAKSWIDIGLKTKEHYLANYLRNKKNFNPHEEYLTELRKKYYSITDNKLGLGIISQIRNFKHSYDAGRELKIKEETLINELISDVELREKYKKYGLCRECNQPKDGNNWYISCQLCISKHFQQEFSKWTSGNQEIDGFIQKHQLNVAPEKILEWIPYEQFTDIEYLAEGGFGKVYKAKCAEGRIESWNVENNEWERDKYSKEVALKVLNSSQDVITDFLQEISNHQLLDDDLVVKCYGISQDPQTGNYIMVTNYMTGGSLRQYLGDNYRELRFEGKLVQLSAIAKGLNSIHEKGLIHKDFHPGNILNSNSNIYTNCYITDLGLCKPAGETSQEKVFGVLPYVAPEVLQSQPYTQASDIYSFGIVAYEVLSGLPPYYELRAERLICDEDLALEICRGLRPCFSIKVPQPLVNLIGRCWDADPSKRPAANELSEILYDYFLEVYSGKDSEFSVELREAEEHNKKLPDHIKFPQYKLRQRVAYHSKLLPTKEITHLMQNFNLQAKTLELNTQLIQVKELANKMATKSKAEQKYNDLKKALKLAFEKSDELEKIIADNQLNISEEIKEILKSKLIEVKELKTKLKEFQGENDSYKQLQAQKEKELAELKKTIITKHQLEEDDLEDILEDQEQAIKNNDEKFAKKLERTKRKLLKIITETEINRLCQLQTEITSLELKLNKSFDQKTKQLTQIINNINIQQGNAFIGNQIGNQANFTYNNQQTVNWINLHPNFNQSLINQWQSNNLTYQQTQDWANVFGPHHFDPQEIEFVVWLRDSKKLTPEQVLNSGDLSQLKIEFQQTQSQIQLPPKSN